MKYDPGSDTKKMLDGNGAAVEALCLARVKVISAYPITPQSPIAERLSRLVETGELHAKYIRVESEHTAMSAAIGAQLTGVRAATATASVGLALMHEILGVASGCRVPIVMPVVNRALVSPWSLWCDHQDSMAERDSGWLQFYVQTVQEVMDYLLMAYKIAEHKHVLLPTMVCMDGFYLSHSTQPVIVPEASRVDEFLGEYTAKNLFLDPKRPMFINNLTSPDEFSEMRFQQERAYSNSMTVIPEVQQEFLETFGRECPMLEGYHCEGADTILVTMGSMSGTAKHVVGQLRKEGKKVGLVRIVSFRPFPHQQLKQLLSGGGGKRVVGVLDRSAPSGAKGGPVWQEVVSALHPGTDESPSRIYSYVGGLGGRDVTEESIKKIFAQLSELKDNPTTAKGEHPAPVWIDTRDNAMDIRRIKNYV